MSYVGRFAPSPTGPLHFGSLVAALASWLDARAAGGRWLVRMEDLDRPRLEAGAAAEILGTLQAFSLHWDGDVEYQGLRGALYRDALSRLEARGLIYPCGCSRAEIADSALAIDGGRVYPGTCRGGLPPGKAPRAYRLRTAAEVIRFEDRVQGPQSQSVARDIGDYVLGRADGSFAYQLAVVVDDAAQGITDVVRGADLLDSTPRQIYLQRLLGYPQPRYLHVPVAINARGEKLSKQTGAAAADARQGAALADALRFLGQPVPRQGNPADMLAQAVRAWDPRSIPARRSVSASPAASQRAENR